MADRGPNLDLWMVTSGPCQPLKYPEVFLCQNVAVLFVRQKHNSSPTVLSDCRSGCWSATLQRTPELGLFFLSGSKKLFRHNCSTIARHCNVSPGGNSGFKARKQRWNYLSENNAIIQIYLCTYYERYL